MPLFPLFANLQARAVLVIGGGEVATRKVLALLKAGAHIRLYAHALSPELEVLMQAGRFEQLRGSFDAAWIDDVWLVVAATDDTALNQQRPPPRVHASGWSTWSTMRSCPRIKCRPSSTATRW